MAQDTEAMEQLERYMMGTRDHYEALYRAVKRMVAEANRAAYGLAQARAEWHDDPEADDHAAFHAPAHEQFPPADRRAVVKSIVEYHLTELDIQEEAGQ